MHIVKSTIPSIPGITDQLSESIWNIFGQYIATQLNNSKSVSIHKFGLFTFASDKKPLFLISNKTWPSYISCIFNKTLRPYQMRHASFFTMPICYSDIALQLAKIQQSTDVKFWKQQVQTTLEQIFMRLMKQNNLQIEIPHVGTLLIQDNLVGVDFKPSFQPKFFLQRSATSNQLKRLTNPSTSQQHKVSVEDWLASNWDIHLDKMNNTQKPTQKSSKALFPTQRLLDEFEKHDERYSGVIDLANFKTCLKKVGLEAKDTTQQLIKYSQYLKEANETNEAWFSKKFKSYKEKNGTNFTKMSQKNFINFLIDKGIFSKNDRDRLEEMNLDINKDGYIDEHDLEAVLDERVNIPNVQFSITKLERIFRELKKSMQLKKLSEKEAYKILDDNNDGFITYSEFKKNLDKIIELSENCQDGLFNYLDKQKIGMISKKRWIEIMCRYTLQVEDYEDDSFKYQEYLLDTIKKWYNQSGVGAEEAFNIVDCDFDGVISQKDLYQFLSMLIDKEELSDLRLQRLMKLLDRYKRGYIQKSDFCDFVNGKESNKDWVDSCKQSIALHLFNKYENLQDAFNDISRFQRYMTYDQWKRFLDKSLALHGYNLTEQLVQELFSKLDVHKKGNVTYSDWIQAFSKYHKREQLDQEEIQKVKEYFLLFLSNFNYISSLQNKRISSCRLKKINASLAPKEIKFEQVDNYQENRSRIKQKLLSAQWPQFNENKMSNIQFKHLLQRLNVGLTNDEINLLIQQNAQQGLIDMNEFLQRQRLSKSEVLLKERGQLKMQQLKRMFYTYMLSPKEAFNIGCGKGSWMDYKAFEKLLQRLWLLAGESDTISVQVMKDLFNWIDLKHDAIIDKNEWNEAFKEQSNKKIVRVASMGQSRYKWECSIQQEKVIRTIGKQRKLILDKCKQESINKNMPELSQKIRIEKLKEILEELFKKDQITDICWESVYGFCEKEGEINYHYFLEIYKDRYKRIQ